MYLYIHRGIHTSACFLLKIALHKHASARSNTQTWVLEIIFTQGRCHSDGSSPCCQQEPHLERAAVWPRGVWSLHGEGHLQKRRLLEGEKGPWGKFCFDLYAATWDYVAARDSASLWASDGALSSWVILLRGFSRTIQVKIRNNSKLCLHSLLSLILHIP